MGMTKRRSPLRTIPASLFPMAIVPISLYLSMMDIRNGASGSIGMGDKPSKICDNPKRLTLLHFQSLLFGECKTNTCT